MAKMTLHETFAQYHYYYCNHITHGSRILEYYGSIGGQSFTFIQRGTRGRSVYNFPIQWLTERIAAGDFKPIYIIPGGKEDET